MKTILKIILVALVVVVSISYAYINYEMKNQFIIDAATIIDPLDAPIHLNNVVPCDFRLVNIGKYAVTLTSVKFGKHSGIALENLRAGNGKQVNSETGLYIPSHRVYSDNGWSTDSKGEVFTYDVKVLSPEIFNPRTIIVTYKLLGITKEQTLELPFS